MTVKEQLDVLKDANDVNVPVKAYVHCFIDTHGQAFVKSDGPLADLVVAAKSVERHINKLLDESEAKVRRLEAIQNP